MLRINSYSSIPCLCGLLPFDEGFPNMPSNIRLNGCICELFGNDTYFIGSI